MSTAPVAHLNGRIKRSIAALKARPLLLVEWGAAISGVVGSEVLAQKTDYSPYGWLIWILSNVLWIMFSIKRRTYGLLAMQVFYTGISIQGAMNWLHR
ncbi:nicotinamide mononucleotide transporter [Paraburkholderia humisilvae]|uniref:Uncharacterized protein n=1 Tax=Paraburkholderia humisilvae TaxID=627669 RepID=A0A6J5DKL8_9BURK|nr:nicotinamide mononucleotide transporter [Paraburkholderia humisilvae]CAB3754729.1 hypothetical protein LMG29542_02437 [Paraburkholderia humisilvae]